MKTYTHITQSEQRRIERQLVAGEGVRSIARLLHRSAGSISDELKRNSVKGIYTADKAHHKAYVARKQSKIQSLSVIKDSKTQRYFTDKLQIGWSAELTAGRWKSVLGHTDGPSTKAAYKFLHSPYGKRLRQSMPSHTWKKKSGPKRGVRVHLDGRHMIDERPKKVEKRKEFGHFEMDFVESGRDGKGSLLVLTERMTRYPLIRYTESRKTEHINNLVAETLSGVPVLSITTDNDISFQKHEELSDMLQADIFFCHPYHSWEKGTVENRNGAIRKPLPKGTDFSQVPMMQIMKVEHDLHQRPMKILGYKTPLEAWMEQTRKYERKNHAVGQSTTIFRRGMMVEKLLINNAKCSV